MSVDGDDIPLKISKTLITLYLFSTNTCMDTYWNESNWLEFLKMFDISHWYV